MCPDGDRVEIPRGSKRGVYLEQRAVVFVLDRMWVGCIPAGLSDLRVVYQLERNSVIYGNVALENAPTDFLESRIYTISPCIK